MAGLTPEEMKNLKEAYSEMRNERARIARRIRAEYKPLIETAIAEAALEAEIAFAVKLEAARKRGATRGQLREVIGDGTASVMRRYIELGGGKTRSQKRETQETPVVTDIRKARGGRYWFSPETGYEVAVELRWDKGRAYIWPTQPTEVRELRDRFGISRDELYAKGEEVARVFDIAPPREVQTGTKGEETK